MRTPASAFVFAFALIMLAPTADAQPGQVLSQQPPVRTSAPGQPTLQGESCIAGRVFGITSYQCTTCNMSNPRDSTHVVYTFSSEPLVVETDNPNRIRPGDRVVSVNGNPIMTRAGADQFAYPPPGMATIAVRRNNVIINFEQPVPPTRVCPVYFRGGYGVLPDSVQRMPVAAMAGGRVSAQQGGGGGGGGGRGGAGGIRRPADSLAFAVLDTVSLRLLRTADSVRIARGGAPQGGGARGVQILRSAPAPAEQLSQTVPVRAFGLVLACHPICTRTRTRDGTTMYWRFDSYPTISNPVGGTVAAKAGLRDGDVLLSVNGISPQVEEGALILNRAGEQVLRLEVRRDEKVEKITLKQ